MLRQISRFFAGLIIRYIQKPIMNYQSYQFIPLAELEKNMRPGDVMLVEGNQRVSSAIKYLTQSTWSHAAFYVGREAGLKDEHGHTASLIEADLSDGVISVSMTKYLGYNTRICRPSLITAEDNSAVQKFIIESLGMSYDIKNVVDLARFLLPQPPVPESWKRRMIALGSGEPSQAICSTLIARAFQSVGYPILPQITRENQREVLHIRHHSLFTPRDFDLSPYFEVIKPTIQKRPDYKKFEWRETPVEDTKKRPKVAALKESPSSEA